MEDLTTLLVFIGSIIFILISFYIIYGLSSARKDNKDNTEPVKDNTHKVKRFYFADGDYMYLIRATPYDLRDNTRIIFRKDGTVLKHSDYLTKDALDWIMGLDVFSNEDKEEIKRAYNYLS